MKKSILLLLLAFSLVSCNTESNVNEDMVSHEETVVEIEQISKIEGGFIMPEIGKSTIIYEASDGLMITSDIYLIDYASPFIILFHRADWSRGEYIETAIKFNKLGYNVMAVDQRSGSNINGIINETAKLATKENYTKDYISASADITASIEYVRDTLKFDSIYIMGSSYSASLVLVIAQQYDHIIDGVIAFSPGEYFTYNGKDISTNVETLTIPVFITSSKSEAKSNIKIFNCIASENKIRYVPKSSGAHGSQSLWSSVAGYEECWNELVSFLDTTRQTK